jgi:phosphoribosyl-ATP pyrophosphohydrolase/phosphoribosyl-AMP cyclohydrolase
MPRACRCGMGEARQQPLELADVDGLDFSKDAGLLPAIVQHAGSGAVLMLGYMNRDALLATAWPRGPVCHLGTASCFGDAPRTTGEHLAFLDTLARVIGERMAARSEGSYTARLVARGAKCVAQKVGEEGLEVALAGAGGSDAEVVAEAADLLYHVLVLLRVRGLPLERVVGELRARHAAKP